MFKYKIATISILLFLVSGNLLFADSNQSLIEKANSEYINGNYEQAIETYNLVLETDYESALLYYNIGNAYYKNNQLAYSILFFEKAKLLAPNDEDINFNLELANSHTTDKIEAIPELFIKNWYNTISSIYTSDFWAIVSMITFFVGLLFLSLFLFSRKSSLKRTAFYFSMLLLLSSALSFSFSRNETNKQTAHNCGIIFNSITVKSSPDNNGTDLFLLHEGTKVEILEPNNEWVKIKLKDGSEGWVTTENMKII